MRAGRGAGLDRLGCALLLAAFLACAAAVAGLGEGRARAQLGPGELTTEPILRSAAGGVEFLFGASPGEAPGEVWGEGGGSRSSRYLVRYTDASGWTRFPSPLGLNGAPLLSFQPSAGRTTESGGVVLAVSADEGEGPREALALRSPGGEFHLTPPVALPPEPEEPTAEPTSLEQSGPARDDSTASRPEAELAALTTEEESGEEAIGEESEAILEAEEEAIPGGGETPGEEPRTDVEGAEATTPTEEGTPPTEETIPGEEGSGEESPPGEGGTGEGGTPGEGGSGEGTPTEEGEGPVTLFSDPPLIAPSEEAGGLTGAFSVVKKPEEGPQDEVLHFDGSSWSRETVCMATPAVEAETEAECAKPLASFTVLAIAATGPGNAWLLGERGAADGLELFKLEGDEWRQQVLGGSLGLEYDRRTPAPGVVVTPSKDGQPLTLSGTSGLWVDAEIGVGTETFDSTIYIAGDRVEGAWCDATGAAATLCTSPLGSELPSGPSRSFAWTGNESEPFGTRVITGVGRGALLIFSGASFERVALGSGDAGEEFGAAFDTPEEGWLGRRTGPLRVTREPAVASLAPFPVPFRRPLTAIAPAPGQPVGSLSSEAMAVGDQGQVARYIPEQGWQAESLLNSAGARVTPRLRAVAWPEPAFAFAVGDEGAMWYWRKSTGLWEPDPAPPPNLIGGNFTGIAFDPGEPTRGYAVGKQGLLLTYGRQWTPESLPAGVPAEANLTSISFAGGEALATWRYPLAEKPEFEGGMIANDGSGWKVVPEIGAIGVPIAVSGLPDGGAAVAFEEGEVAERNAPGAAWIEAPEGAGGYPVAMQALREEGAVRAVVSVWPEAGAGIGYQTDFEQVAAHDADAPPILTKPSGLAQRGYLERQTAGGWRDEQHESFPTPSDGTVTDLPREPDPILALLVSPSGGEGWVVGGETGERVVGGEKSVQTASVERYGTAASPPPYFSGSTIPTEAGKATFAIGGGAQCAALCADQIGTGIGPEAWLAAAVSRAAGVPGMRAFLYSGGGVASAKEESVDLAKRAGAVLSPAAFGREEIAYARRLLAGSAGLPVMAAPTSTDLDRQESLSTFAGAFAGASPIPAGELARGYYSFESSGSGPSVRVVVLDYALPTLGAAQQCWVSEQLEAAGAVGEPTIVLGARDLGGVAPPEARAADASEVTDLLVEGTSTTVAATCPRAHPVGASAYFFDFPEGNRTYRLSAGGRSIPTFGSGTLGYVTSFDYVTDFTGASGFLLASVGTPDPATDVAPVSAHLIPNLGELAMEATDGTLLRRSSVALFRGLARRPRGGGRCGGGSPQSGCESLAPDPYVPIPAVCRGVKCSTAILPEYKFSSSRPDIADFVAAEGNSGSSHAVKVGADGKPIPDPTSGLLCAFNAGTTTVTLEAGGLAYSTVVTVQGGSVQRPCGTVPLTDAPSHTEVTVPTVPAPTPSPSPVFHTPTGSLPLPEAPTPSLAPNPPPVVTPTPAPTPPPHAPPNPPPVPSPPPFLGPTSTIKPVQVIVPPPPPPAAEPAPPTGSSPVTQPAVSPEPEEEEEAAFDLVHHAVVYRPEPRTAAALASFRSHSAHSGGAVPGYLLPVLVAFLAVSAAGVAGRRRRRAPEPAFLRNRR